MKIIEPYIEHWKQGDDVKAHVAKCARVCYDKETGNDDVTINTLLKKHHWSMFRHESVYVIGEFTSRLAIALERYSNNPYINWTFHNNKLYIATNGNFCLDLKERQEVNAHAQILLTYINYYRVSEDTFFNDEIGYNMMRYTFCIVTQISTSRELNRVSPNNIAEQSTRYVYKNDTICSPHWLEGYNIVHNIYGKYIVYKDGKEDNDINHNVFKEPDGSIRYNGAFSKRVTDTYNFDTKEWTKNKNPICWHGGLFECKNNVLTGRYFNTCYLQQHDIINGWTPKPTRNIDCVEIEIAPDNWIMAVDTNDIDLIYLSLDYYIQWENCFCMKDIRLEDVTPELEKKAFEEIENNK